MNLETTRPDRALDGTQTHRERRLRRPVSKRRDTNPVLPFPIVWGFQDRPWKDTLEVVCRAYLAKKPQQHKTEQGSSGPRVGRLPRPARVSLLAPISRGEPQISGVARDEGSTLSLSVHQALTPDTTGNARTGNTSPRPGVHSTGTQNEDTQNNDYPGSNPASDRADHDGQTRRLQGVENVPLGYRRQDAPGTVPLHDSVLHVSDRREISRTLRRRQPAGNCGYQRDASRCGTVSLQRFPEGQRPAAEGSPERGTSLDATEQHGEASTTAQAAESLTLSQATQAQPQSCAVQTTTKAPRRMSRRGSVIAPDQGGNDRGNVEGVRSCCANRGPFNS